MLRLASCCLKRFRCNLGRLFFLGLHLAAKRRLKTWFSLLVDLQSAGWISSPKEKLTPDSSITNLSFSFPLDVFQYITDNSSFKESWPQLRDRILTLSQAVILLGSSFGASSVSTSEEIRGLMVEMGLLQDALGSDEDMTDVPFRSSWEGIRYVHQAVLELTTLTLPLLDTKSNESRISLVVDNKVNAIHIRIREIETLIRTIESECLSHFTRLNQLDRLLGDR